MKKKTRWVLPAVFLVFAVFLVYSTFNLKRVRVGVCMEFEGMKACRSAAGATKEEALMAAKTNACAQLTSGMGNTRSCTAQDPLSIDWLESGEDFGENRP